MNTLSFYAQFKDRSFFKQNLYKTNNLVGFILLISSLLGILFAVGTYKSLFSINYVCCFEIFILAIIFSSIQFVLNFFKELRKATQFVGLIFIGIFVSFTSIVPGVGFSIYIAFILVPFVSTLYYNIKLSYITSIISYLLMVVSLYINSHENFLFYSTPKLDPEYFISELLGYSVTYIFVFILTLAVSRSFKTTLELEHSKRIKIKKIQFDLIKTFANIIEWSDSYTGEHIKRTSKYVELISHKLRDMKQYSDILTDEEIDLYVSAAPLHDIGKINVPNNILSKPGKFTPDEYEQMKTHARTGYEIITNELIELEDTDYIKTAGEMALYHHERWDGTGYPNQIAGLTIPLCARIMAAADVLDALLSKRQYKEAFSIDEAMEYFESAKGKHFEPCIAEAVLSLRDEVEQISATNITD